MEQVRRAIHDDDLAAFVSGLQREPGCLATPVSGFRPG